MDEIYYEKKKNKKGLIFGIVSAILFVTLFYCLNFFNINPPYTMKLINSGKMSSNAYGRDFLFSITSKVDNGEIPQLEVILNEITNTNMSESSQNINLIVGKDSFAWEKAYKFNTLIEKTPYDARYIKFDNYINSGYKYSYKKNKSFLLSSILPDIMGNKTNMLLSTRKFESKKIKINAYEKNINDKFKLVYNINLNSEEATKVFEKIYTNVWENEEFKSFFKEDDQIQKKLKVTNNTKNVIDVLDNIKKNLKVNSLKITIISNKNYPESVVLDFDADYLANNTKTPINISLSEFLKSMSNDYSPQDNLNIVSITPIEDLISSVPVVAKK